MEEYYLIRDRPLFAFFLLFATIGSIVYYFGVYQLSTKPLVNYDTFSLALFVSIVVSLIGLWWFGTYGLTNYFVSTNLILH